MLSIQTFKLIDVFNIGDVYLVFRDKFAAVDMMVKAILSMFYH